ncbi:unnamed protein product [Calicophoron daubneyi]|uniref:Ankyrin repeat domain-containing protein n=1 Tax=Calicophoron daubneyi TaxID=300641 RepID=A0AAV2TPE0_CALDB
MLNEVNSLSRGGAETAQIGLLIYLAAANGDKEKLERLLRKQRVIDYVEELTGMMATHAAAAWGNPNCLEVLLANGANMNQPDATLCTPLHHAARNGHLATCNWLIEHGGNTVQRSLFGQVPADMALANSFPELADILRREGIRQVKEQAQQPAPGSGKIAGPKEAHAQPSND